MLVSAHVLMTTDRVRSAPRFLPPSGKFGSFFIRVRLTRAGRVVAACGVLGHQPIVHPDLAAGESPAGPEHRVERGVRKAPCEDEGGRPESALRIPLEEWDMRLGSQVPGRVGPRGGAVVLPVGDEGDAHAIFGLRTGLRRRRARRPNRRRRGRRSRSRGGGNEDDQAPEDAEGDGEQKACLLYTSDAADE